jgi:hypothetical protein
VTIKHGHNNLATWRRTSVLPLPAADAVAAACSACLQADHAALVLLLLL